MIVKQSKGQKGAIGYATFKFSLKQVFLFQFFLAVNNYIGIDFCCKMTGFCTKVPRNLNLEKLRNGYLFPEVLFFPLSYYVSYLKFTIFFVPHWLAVLWRSFWWIYPCYIFSFALILQFHYHIFLLRNSLPFSDESPIHVKFVFPFELVCWICPCFVLNMHLHLASFYIRPNLLL